MVDAGGAPNFPPAADGTPNFPANAAGVTGAGVDEAAAPLLVAAGADGAPNFPVNVVGANGLDGAASALAAAVVDAGGAPNFPPAADGAPNFPANAAGVTGAGIDEAALAVGFTDVGRGELVRPFGCSRGLVSDPVLLKVEVDMGAEGVVSGTGEGRGSDGIVMRDVDIVLYLENDRCLKINWYNGRGGQYQKENVMHRPGSKLHFYKNLIRIEN